MGKRRARPQHKARVLTPRCVIPAVLHPQAGQQPLRAFLPQGPLHPLHFHPQGLHLLHHLFLVKYALLLHPPLPTPHLPASGFHPRPTPPGIHV